MAARKKVTHKWTTKKPSMPSENAGKSAWDKYKKQIRDYNWTQRQIASAKQAARVTPVAKKRPTTRKKRRTRR